MSVEASKRIDTDLREEIGKRIESLRVEQNMSREDVANQVGISTKFLYEVEKGKKGISAEILLRIAQILSSSCDYILTGDKLVNKRKNKDVLDSFNAKQRKKMEEIIRLIYEVGKDV